MKGLRGDGWKAGIGAATLFCTSLAAVTAAQAGAFAVREQSAYYQGMSFAGAGTGDTLSSMYWNSAAAAAAPGMNSESHVTLIVPDTQITATSPYPSSLPISQSGDIADPAVIPASYANYQLTDQLYLGIAMNSGFGLVTKPDNTTWIGSGIALTSDVFSMNVNPTLAYRITPDLTVGIGVQVEYLDVRLNNGPSPTLPEGRSAELDDVGFGATAGVMWTPVAGTTLGVGYRSAVKFDLSGDYSGLLNTGTPLGIIDISGPASAQLTLPDIITVGLRQKLTDRLDLLAGFEWTNWSRVGTIPVEGTPESLRLNYDDGYFYSIGLEYDYTPDTTLRAGVAYEETPISDKERNVLLPDANRLWLSVGATHRFSDKVSVDLGYTHIFADDAPICRDLTPGAPPCTGAAVPRLEANGESSVDIVSASFKYKWGGAEPELEPLK